MRARSVVRSPFGAGWRRGSIVGRLTSCRPSRIDAYLIRLIAVPLFSVILITVALMFLQYMPVLFYRIIQESGGMHVAWKMLDLLIPEYLDLGLPIGLFLGVLLAFRRLVLDQEMEALTATGASPVRLLRVPMIYAAAISCLSFLMLGFVQPLSTTAYYRLGYLVQTGAFGLPMQVGVFNRLADDVTLRMDTMNAGSGKMTGMFLQSAVAGKRSFVATAQEGQFIKVPRTRGILLRLRNGRAVIKKNRMEDMQVIDFDQYDVPVVVPRSLGFRPGTTAEEEMTLPQLAREWGDRSRGRALRHFVHAELQRRIILMLLPGTLPFLAFAVSRPPPRSRSFLGMVAGLLLVVLLLKALDIGVRATEWAASPLQWGIFGLFAAIVARMYYLSSFKVGADPLSFVYRASAHLGGQPNRRRQESG